MTFLFLFAHPDDETVSCGATIKQLIDAGHEVVVVSMTDGGAGDVMPEAQDRFQELGSVGQLRREELKKVAALFNLEKLHILDFQDGRLNNIDVWGKLKETCLSLINQYKPDFVVTFDHTGWYFHLDHIAVSIAATLAFRESEHRPLGLLLAHLRVNFTHWNYVFPDVLPLTHVVDATPHKDFKLEALALHASQDTTSVEKKINKEKQHFETFQLVGAEGSGVKKLQDMNVFLPISAGIKKDIETDLGVKVLS